MFIQNAEEKFLSNCFYYCFFYETNLSNHFLKLVDNSQSANTGQSFRSPEYSADDIQVLSRQENEGAQDWEDSWDEDTGSGNQKTSDASKDAPAGFLSVPSIEKKSSSTGDLTVIARGDAGGKLGIKKSFNRFSAFVKSGGEMFILGETSVNVSAEDYVEITEDEGEVRWIRSGEPYSCTVSKPKKESKLRGLKSYIAYQITPSFSNIEVSRRFKHFDWLHERLETKYALIPIPPLPGKQFSGRYEDMFIEHRMIQLQMWVNRICHHPVLGHCDVWKHFITCTDEKMWKTGKRRAERDELVGASYFHAIKAPDAPLDPFQVDNQVENFSKFSAKMDNTVKQLHGTAQELCKKYSGSSFLMSQIKYDYLSTKCLCTWFNHMAWIKPSYIWRGGMIEYILNSVTLTTCFDDHRIVVLELMDLTL
ncbi:UNVERIFIED_CONTAM: lst-4 [Trichonephila clavipes]